MAKGTPDGALSPPTKKAKVTKSKKRGRPPKLPSYPPPPPPPPPPTNNPYYQKFFDDYWRKYGAGFQLPGAAPPAPRGMPLAVVPAMTTVMTMPPAIAPPAPKIPATRVEGGLTNEEYPIKTDRQTFVLALPNDIEYLSEKQCFVRTRLIEVFLSEAEDVERASRRRRAAFVGQVGLRCVFCVPAMDSKDRVERAICYPTCTSKFYQTCQDMQHFHFATCPAIPSHVRTKYQNLVSTMNNRRGNDKMSPKDYWAKCCADVGMVDNIGEDGTNAGVKLKEGHGLVPRTQLPEYAQELFLPPNKDGEEGKDAVDVKVDETGSFGDLVEELDDAKTEENNDEEPEEKNDDGDEEMEGEDDEEVGESC